MAQPFGHVPRLTWLGGKQYPRSFNSRKNRPGLGPERQQAAVEYADRKHQALAEQEEIENKALTEAEPTPDFTQDRQPEIDHPHMGNDYLPEKFMEDLTPEARGVVVAEMSKL